MRGRRTRCPHFLLEATCGRFAGRHFRAAPGSVDPTIAIAGAGSNGSPSGELFRQALEPRHSEADDLAVGEGDVDLAVLPEVTRGVIREVQ